MISAAIPINETVRLNELLKYSLFDTLPEEEYDDLTLLASQICNTPIALISLIDTNRQWFKSNRGLAVPELPRESSFCAHAINDCENIMVVPDSRLDIRFADNPLVTGEPFVVFYTGIPLVNSEGYALGTLCVIDNKPNELNETQINSLKALSNQVIRSFELRKSKMLLLDSQKKLESKNLELEQFARVAAHDLKSPLNSIMGVIQLLKQDHANNLNAEALDLLAMLSDSSNNLKSLVDGILNHSRCELFLKENKEKLELNNLCADVITLIDNQRQHTFLLPSISNEININKTGLQQILINLLSNAIKYNDKVQTIIEIGFAQSDREYLFTVKDNGPGIKKELQEKVFKIFEVLGNDRFGNRGNGIGLSTVKKLIEGQGGKITVNSELGKGAQFEFTIQK